MVFFFSVVFQEWEGGEQYSRKKAKLFAYVAISWYAWKKKKIQFYEQFFFKLNLTVLVENKTKNKTIDRLLSRYN